jgi:hypothetical protein
MGFNSGFKGLNSAVYCPRWFMSLGSCRLHSMQWGQGGFQCDEHVYPNNHVQRIVEILQPPFFLASLVFLHTVIYTGLFISPSRISDLCGTVTGMVTSKGSMLTEGEILQFSVPPYRFSICPLLVTRQVSNLAILADYKTQNASLFPVHAMFRHDCPLTVKLASTQ